VRVLSKDIDNATYGQKKELNRILNFIANNKKGLKMEPTNEEIWEIEALSDTYLEEIKMEEEA
jgi:uncharacterized protein YnzC (UPF0291/DUF896 family)